MPVPGRNFYLGPFIFTLRKTFIQCICSDLALVSGVPIGRRLGEVKSRIPFRGLRAGPASLSLATPIATYPNTYPLSVGVRLLAGSNSLVRL